MIDPELLPFIIFFAAIAFIVYYDRRNIEFHGPLLIRKTIRGKGFIINTALRFRRFWGVFGTIAVVAGFIASFVGIYVFLTMVIESFTTMAPVAGAGLVLPSPVAVIGGGYIGVPLWYWLVSVILLLVVHEGAHGIIGASQGMKIKKLGWMLFTLLPMGAFVEPDEEDVKKKAPMKQLRFFAAGSFANFLLAFLVAAVITPLLLNPLMVPAQGLRVLPQEGFPFAGSPELAERTDNFSQGLNPKFFIMDINGHQIQNHAQATETLDMLNIRPGQTVELNVDVYYGNSMDNVDISIQAAQNPNNESKGYIGILFDERQYTVVKQEMLPFRETIFFFAEMFFWVFLINLGVGLFNMMPMGPLDGKRMWALVLQRYIPKRHRIVMRVIEVFTLFLLLAILVPAIISNFL
jgi:membrane-associated protease RseP (regulator of RpoE activity)